MYRTRRILTVVVLIGVAAVLGYASIIYRVSLKDSISKHALKSLTGEFSSYNQLDDDSWGSENSVEMVKWEDAEGAGAGEEEDEFEIRDAASQDELTLNTPDDMDPDSPEVTSVSDPLDINHNKTRLQIRQDQSLPAKSNRFVILTTIDSQFISLMDNWLESLKRLGLRYNITLICEDDKAHKYFLKKESDYFKVLNTRDYTMLGKLKRRGKGTTYQQLIKRRTLYVKELLVGGTDVLLVDIDAVWLKDPIDIIRQSYNRYDMWVAQGFEPGVPCPCFLYLKSVPPIVKLAGQWMHRLSDNKRHTGGGYETDQFALQFVMRHRPDLKLLTLDKVRFPTGKEYFEPDWNNWNVKNVYIAHGNHLGREVGKIDKFKEFGLWLI